MAIGIHYSQCRGIVALVMAFLRVRTSAFRSPAPPPRLRMSYVSRLFWVECAPGCVPAVRVMAFGASRRLRLSAALLRTLVGGQLMADQASLHSLGANSCARPSFPARKSFSVCVALYMPRAGQATHLRGGELGGHEASLTPKRGSEVACLVVVGQNGLSLAAVGRICLHGVADAWGLSALSCR